MSTEPHPPSSWGRVPTASQQTTLSMTSRHTSLPDSETSMLPFGLGRSYGDSCLNNGETLLRARDLDRWISFDKDTGVLCCEAGLHLGEILDLVVPSGWFLPVTPGTKYVTIGGAIANDVHGKNHHKAGTFGAHVQRFELLRSDGSRTICSREDHADLFRATVGGLGLTGLITWAEVQLKATHGPFIESEHIAFPNLSAFFDLAQASDTDFEYTVAWVDCLSSGDKLARGIFSRGNTAPAGATGKIKRTKPLLTIPIDAPSALLSNPSIHIFNHVYARKIPGGTHRGIEHYEPFFYPLDILNDWNRLYGARGFFQHQCVVPFDPTGGPIRDILNAIAKSGQASFLAVLKLFGDIPPEGMLSFPRHGVTLALDFANRGESTRALMDELDVIVSSNGGAVYPAKDARMAPALFKQAYPQWEAFSAHIDPAFSSSFWRRMHSSSQV